MSPSDTKRVRGDVVSLLEDVCSDGHFQLFVVTCVRLEFAKEGLVADRRFMAVQVCEFRLGVSDQMFRAQF